MKQIGGMWFPDGDRHFAAQLAHGPVVDGRGTYQFRKYAAALPHVPGRGLAIDIGAHVGLWTRVMALDFARVVAFEPLPEHVACFERNLKGAQNVELKPVALGEKVGKLGFAAAGDNSGNAHVVNDGGLDVPMRSLDSLRLRNVDLVKIDVEGFEAPVLKGGEKTIRREQPAVIIEAKPNGSAERYGRCRFDALDMLKDWGGVVAWEIGGDFLVTFPRKQA